MQRKCLKCAHVNPAATGDALEACPSCGAIYSRVEAAFAARANGEQRPPVVRPMVEPAPRANTQIPDDTDVHAFADTLRAESLYPTFRSLVRVFYWFFILLSVIAAIGTLVTLFRGSGIGRIGGTIGGVFMTLFFILIARLVSETSMMMADLSDAAVRIAESVSRK